jgi:hypothetical protein
MKLPDFVILGAMKAGTTSLFRWLERHPDVALPEDKEPAFFSRDDRWARGVGSYAKLFAALPSDKLSGEASVHYSDPAVASRAAARLHEVLPEARLIFLARDPAERLRSHYRHQVQRGRERRPLLEALSEPDSPYVRCSLYDDALRPYLERFARERLLLVDFASLIGPSERSWHGVLEFLNLTPMPRPAEAHNVTADKRRFSPLMRRAYDLGLARFEKRIPGGVRKLLRPLAFRGGAGYDALLQSAKAPLPAPLQTRLDEHYQDLVRQLGPLR